MMALHQARAQDRYDWSSEHTAILEQGLAELGLEATRSQQERLRCYGRLLLKWNRTYNLLGATTARAMIKEHLLDSLAVLPALKRWWPDGGRTIVDIGTGGGLPGVVLAVMLPDVRVVLVEPVGKKIAFLRQVVAECGLRSTRVVGARIEDVHPADLAPVAPSASQEDTAPSNHSICRAFASLSRFAELCEPHLDEGSLLFAMKAAKVPEELSQLDHSIEVLAVEPLRTVEKDVQRNLVVMRWQQAASNPTRPAR
jgi:16S rRNA (guanine527-N7)-methyltransferase